MNYAKDLVGVELWREPAIRGTKSTEYVSEILTNKTRWLFC